ncbi:hypothetical protein [Bacillus horti]|uniref:Cyclic lactone autoinducer peptide n=1 Tax=Caldalkalibacillus horti TaxID=77523 RepID=A0ABT9VX20_9BACI|nr:hypothetical protein [Bacillus horti]MDQ0165424.1 hypothetical protein [Bacillus horti]
MKKGLVASALIFILSISFMNPLNDGGGTCYCEHVPVPFSITP